VRRWIPPSRIPLEAIAAIIRDEPKPFDLRWPEMQVDWWPESKNRIVLAGAEARA